MATHLGLAFAQKGCAISQVWSRNTNHAAALADRLGATTVADLERLDTDSDLYIIAVSDDAIADVASRLNLGDRMVVHTSGATPLSAIATASSRTGVLWSPQTFVKDVAMDYSQLIFSVEGNSDESTAFIEKMALALTPTVHRMDSPTRLRCHLAAVMVNNFGNALNAMAEQMLQADGFDLSLLRPIIRQTAAKAENDGLWRLQTGPAARNDRNTIEAHRRILAQQNPRLLQLYDAFTQIITDETH